MNIYDSSLFGLYMDGKRIGECVGSPSRTDLQSGMPPDHGLGTLKPTTFTFKTTMTMTPEQSESWRKFVEHVAPIRRLSRKVKKHNRRIDREFRRMLVRIAGSAHLLPTTKRRMVHTESLRALGIRIPRSLR